MERQRGMGRERGRSSSVGSADLRSKIDEFGVWCGVIGRTDGTLPRGFSGSMSLLFLFRCCLLHERASVRAQCSQASKRASTHSSSPKRKLVDERQRNSESRNRIRIKVTSAMKGLQEQQYNTKRNIQLLKQQSTETGETNDSFIMCMFFINKKFQNKLCISIRLFCLIRSSLVPSERTTRRARWEKREKRGGYP